jgi:ATP-dependent Clp protease ATP-binding subunit ClpB
MEKRVTEALRAHFKPEFLNRIDETIIFQNLTPDQISKIVEIQVKKLSDRLAEKNIELILSDNAIAHIADKGYDPVYGARPLKRAIQQYIENPLSMEILKGKIAEGAQISAEAEGNQITFKTI